MILALTIIAGLLALVVAWTLVWARRRIAQLRALQGGDTTSVSPPDPGEQVVRLGGRDFRVARRCSVKCDGYMINMFRRAGLMPLPGMTLSETPGEYGLRMLDRLRDEKGALLGGLLLPVGMTEKQWTPAIAAETEAHVLYACTSIEDRQKIENLTLSLMLHFFEGGIASSLALLSSSPAPTKTSTTDPSTMTTKNAEPGAAFSSS